MPPTLPEWCSWGVGDSPFLILAPHGGQRLSRSPAQPRRDGKPTRINDLHSADVALQIAARLNGSFIVNHSMDRNVLDLNRISQVATRARWLLEIMELLVDRILGKHEEARILVVHGWNVHQCRCDIGIGANLEQHGRQSTSELTVSGDFLTRYLTPLTAIPETQATLGRRYPARHRNNLLQLFRRDGSRSDALPARLAGHVRQRRCQAIQLELGIPLRWPGPLREAFVERLCAILQSTPRRARDQRDARVRISTVPSTTRAQHSKTNSLQFFDPSAGVTVLASIDRPAGDGAFFGRVALFLADGRVALYTGEARDASTLGRDGPVFSHVDDLGDPADSGESTTLTFDGSMLITADGDGYVDLEYALAHGVLTSTRIYLQLGAPPEGERTHPAVRGHIEIGDRRIAIDAPGFTASREWGRGWGAPRRAGRSHVSVRANFDDGTASVLSADSRGSHKPEYVRVELADDGYSPESISIATRGRVAHIRPLNRMAIARPVGAKRRARVTFGPATIEIEGSATRGTAIYEYTRLIDR